MTFGIERRLQRVKRYASILDVGNGLGLSYLPSSSSTGWARDI